MNGQLAKILGVNLRAENIRRLVTDSYKRKKTELAEELKVKIIFFYEHLKMKAEAGNKYTGCS